MIPAMIMFGFVLGRWWKVTVPFAAVTWPLVLILSGIDLDRSETAGAAILGVVDATVGAALHLAVAGLVTSFVRFAEADTSGP